MPRVGKTHFAYTPAGKLKAEAFAKKTGQKVVHAKNLTLCLYYFLYTIFTTKNLFSARSKL